MKGHQGLFGGLLFLDLRKIANKEFQNRVLETEQKAAQQTSIFYRFYVFSPGFTPR